VSIQDSEFDLVTSPNSVTNFGTYVSIQDS